MPVIGDPVKYRSLAGDLYDAVVSQIIDPETVTLDVIVPGCSKAVVLTCRQVGEGGWRLATATMWPRQM